MVVALAPALPCGRPEVRAIRPSCGGGGGGEACSETCLAALAGSHCDSCVCGSGACRTTTVPPPQRPLSSWATRRVLLLVSPLSPARGVLARLLLGPAWDVNRQTPRAIAASPVESFCRDLRAMPPKKAAKKGGDSKDGGTCVCYARPSQTWSHGRAAKAPFWKTRSEALGAMHQRVCWNNDRRLGPPTSAAVYPRVPLRSYGVGCRNTERSPLGLPRRLQRRRRGGGDRGLFSFTMNDVRARARTHFAVWHDLSAVLP